MALFCTEKVAYVYIHNVTCLCHKTIFENATQVMTPYVLRKQRNIRLFYVPLCDLCWGDFVFYSVASAVKWSPFSIPRALFLLTRAHFHIVCVYNDDEMLLTR